MSELPESQRPGAVPGQRSRIGRIPSGQATGLPKRTPQRVPRSRLSRLRRWLESARPRFWTWITGNTNARRGSPWQTSLYVIMLLIALATTAAIVLVDRGPTSTTEVQ